MALIKCSECGRDVSDKAPACPGCGAPIATSNAVQPTVVTYVRESDTFSGTMALMVKLAMRAVQDLEWKIDQVNESVGMVTFQTGMSWGSWSGVLGSLTINEVGPNAFRVTGTGKQNVSGLQLAAPNFGGEAQGKARKVIERMKEMAAWNEG